MKMAEVLYKTVWQFLKNLNIKSPSDPAIPFLGIYLREMKTRVHPKICAWSTTAALFIITKEVETTQMLFRGQMDKQNVVYLCSGIVFNHKKKKMKNWYCYETGESWDHLANEKRPHVVQLWFHEMFNMSKSLEIENRLVTEGAKGGENMGCLLRGTGFLWGYLKYPRANSDCDMMLWISWKKCSIVGFTMMNYVNSLLVKLLFLKPNIKWTNWKWIDYSNNICVNKWEFINWKAHAAKGGVEISQTLVLVQGLQAWT